MLKAKPAVVTALFLSAAVHAGIIGALAYGIKMKGAPGQAEKSIEVSVNDSKSSSDILPFVKKRSHETKIQKSYDENKPVEIPGASVLPPQGIKEGDAQQSVMNYRDMVRRRLQENRRYPYAARSAGTEGSVGVRFVITENGSVADVSVESGSGSTWLDSSAVEAVRNSSPFPRLPDEYGLSEMEIKVNIIYRLK